MLSRTLIRMVKLNSIKANFATEKKTETREEEIGKERERVREEREDDPQEEEEPLKGNCLTI